MKYIKLIALKVDDLSSTIFFENNYGVENDGCVCIVLETESNITVK